MKSFKFLFLSLALVLLAFTSCTNDESVIEEQQTTEQSESITTALTAMSSNFDQSGNVDTNSNPSGNIVFDFCFDFVYPITLSYNNGTTVTVNDLDGLISVIINSTEQLFVDGIAFPFDVETYDESTDSIVVVTINNESEFEALLADCDFGNVANCACNEVYEPVCVEVFDPSGASYIISYPNECEAICDGFSQEDFIEVCNDNDYFDFGFGCFDINYPIDLILDDGSTITVNSNTEFGNAMFNQYVVNFVYPITVTLEEDGSLLTINSQQEFENLFNNCFGDTTGTGDCAECENEPVEPVCIEYTENGVTIIEVFPNLCFAQCFGFDESDVVECEDDNTGDICDQNVIDAAFNQCQTWEATVNNQVYDYLFNVNGTLQIFSMSGELMAEGIWEIAFDSVQNVPFMVIGTNVDIFTTVWFFTNCDNTGNFEVLTSGGATTNVTSACD